MSSGHSLKTRAEQERISSFLHDNSRRSNSQEKKSRRMHSGSSRHHHHRHPLDPVESDSDSEHRNRHRSNNKSRRRRSYSSPSGSDDERRHRRKQYDKPNETNSRRHRRHSSSSSSNSSPSRSKSRDRKRRNSVEKYERKPTSTIIMSNIPLTFDEHELLTELSIAKVPVQETRIIHRRDPASNLQTAYIEFNTVQEAEEWMTLTQGTFLLNDHPVTLKHRYDDDSSSTNINIQRDYPRNNVNELRLRDWDCYKCGVQNFKRRDHCFNCHISREDSERTRDLDGFSFVGLNPCNTLVLRGLDILTSKETIEAKLIELTYVAMKNCAIVKDNYTGVSRGFAFVEYNSIHDSVLVYEKLQTTTPGVELDGKAVIAHFSKNNFATSLAQIQDEDEDFYTKRSTSSRNRHRHDHDRSSNVGQLLPSNNVDRTNTAAEIAQQALQNIHAQKQRDYTRQQRRRNHSSDDDSSDSSSNQQNKKQRSTKSKEPEQYSTPDPSKFEWFPDVGYHFDKTTGFYFDAKSSYFYNPTTQKYLYWDPAQTTYVQVEDTGVPTAANTNETTNTNTAPTESKEKAEKAKNAQKVAKEMEQWAKKERERKEKEAKRKAQFAATTTSTAISTADSTPASSTASGGSSFADIGLPSNRPTGGLISLNLMSSSSNTSTVNRPALLAAFDNPESDNEDDNDDHNQVQSSKTTTSSTATAASTTSTLDPSEEKLVDWNKMACLLCQRQFDTREIMEKHLQMSNLHKENLAKAGIVRSQTLSYRDRAKERREAYGIEEKAKRNDYSPVHERSYPTTSSSSSSSSSYRAAHQNQPLSSDNIGSKLMKKHGWQEGQGLGKKLQGRADPLQAEMRQRGAGLGASRGLNYQAEPGDSYKDVVRKVARARFSMMES